MKLYRNKLKNLNFGKEAPQDFSAERATIAQRQGASERSNIEKKPTKPKTDSSGSFGITPRKAIFFSGFLWIAIGILLLYKGIQYLVHAGNLHLNSGGGGPLLSFVDRFSKNSEQSAMILICAALLLGIFKGRVMMKRAVNRVVGRIASLPTPIPLSALYSKGYLMLIGGMTVMGMSFKFLPLPFDVKGFIDFTVGAALINGAMLYFRAGATWRVSVR